MDDQLDPNSMPASVERLLPGDTPGARSVPDDAAVDAGSTQHPRPEPAANEPRVTIVVTVRHPLGLHMRIGKEVVLLAAQFDAQMTAHNLTRASPDVDARSILQLMQLQAREGHQLQVSALGHDAAEAVEALRVLLEQATPPHN